MAFGLSEAGFALLVCRQRAEKIWLTHVKETRLDLLRGSMVLREDSPPPDGPKVAGKGVLWGKGATTDATINGTKC